MIYEPLSIIHRAGKNLDRKRPARSVTPEGWPTSAPEGAPTLAASRACALGLSSAGARVASLAPGCQSARSVRARELQSRELVRLFNSEIESASWSDRWTLPAPIKTKITSTNSQSCSGELLARFWRVVVVAVDAVGVLVAGSRRSAR